MLAASIPKYEKDKDNGKEERIGYHEVTDEEEMERLLQW